MSRMRQQQTNVKAIREIETGLKSLTRGLRLLAHSVSATPGNGRAAGRRKVSPALRLQGRYMGLIRTLPQRKKARVMAMRVSKGVEHAIRLAKELRA